MNRKDDDPVIYSDFIDFKVNIERRMSKLETEVDWIKMEMKEIKSTIDKIKWWILLGFFGSSTLVFILNLLVK